MMMRIKKTGEDDGSEDEEAENDEDEEDFDDSHRVWGV